SSKLADAWRMVLRPVRLAVAFRDRRRRGLEPSQGLPAALAFAPRRRRADRLGERLDRDAWFRRLAELLANAAQRARSRQGAARNHPVDPFSGARLSPLR